MKISTTDVMPSGLNFTGWRQKDSFMASYNTTIERNFKHPFTVTDIKLAYGDIENRNPVASVEIFGHGNISPTLFLFTASQ